MFATALPLDVPPAGGRLVSVDGRTLPLRGTRLEADACAGRCRVTLLQSFANPYAEPLEVTYQVPLPADGAVSGYAFHIGEMRITGRIDRLADARQAFTQAIMEGRTAALLEQDRSSLFTQKVGNIPPGEEVVVELTIDQPLVWMQGGWEWRFPTVVAPRYLGHHTPDAARVSVDVAKGEISAKVGLRLSIRDVRTGRVSSPSHAVTDGDTVILDGPDARLDRDVVVRWPVAARVAGVSLDRGRREGDALAYGALTVVPPVVAQVAVPRDLIVLLDTSGSMGGAPLDQAKAVTTALIQGLDVGDRLELMEFSNEPRAWSRGAVFATDQAKADAIRWVSGLRASGGTEMRTGILAALSPLRSEAQRQVVLVTDGLIGFESMVVQAIRDTLPAGSRVHTLGIGSGVNRSLTGPSARAGGGIECIVAPGEDPKPAAELLLARTRSPQVVDLEVSGSAVRGVAPRRLPDLFAGSPARLAVALDPHGGELILRGRTAQGLFEQRIAVPPTSAGTGQAATACLYGREIVEDLELDRATGKHVEAEVEAAGLQYQISTRLTAWIAVTTQVTVDPQAARRQEVMPHLLPHGMSAEGLGLHEVAEGPLGGVAGGMGRAGAAPRGPGAPPMSPSRSRRQSEMAAPPPAPVMAPAPLAPAASVAPGSAEKEEGGVERAERPKGLLSRLVDRMMPEKAKKAEAPAEARAEARAERASSGMASPDPESVARRPEPISIPADEADGFADEAAASLDDALFAGAAAPLEEAPRGPYLAGKVVLRTADRLVIEVVLPFAHDWQPGTEVKVELPNGVTATIAVEAQGTSAAGPKAGGLTLRLVLRLSSTLGEVGEVILADGTVITL